jgi:hypothetical protein
VLAVFKMCFQQSRPELHKATTMLHAPECPQHPSKRSLYDGDSAASPSKIQWLPPPQLSCAGS